MSLGRQLSARRSHFFLVIAMLLCAACSTGAEGEFVTGNPGSPSWVYTAAPETQRLHFETVCTGYGFEPGTPEMTQCMAEETRSARARADSHSQASAAYWQQMAILNAQQQQSTNVRLSTTCHSLGDWVTCN